MNPDVGTNTVRTTLDAIRDLQAVLLEVLDSNLDPESKAVAARRLLSLARATEVPEIALAALGFTLDRHIAEMIDEPGIFGGPEERRMLQMHAAGEVACSTCLRPLTPVAAIQSWQRERHLSTAWRDWLRKRAGGGAA